MTTAYFHQEQEAIETQIRGARANIARLEEQAAGVVRELEGLFGQRQQYEVLARICDSLDSLEQLGAGHLFWGQETGGEEASRRVADARGQASKFLDNIAAIEQRRRDVERRIDDELVNIEAWHAEIAELIDKEERKLSEFLVERDISDVPYRPLVMPWDPDGEDGKRIRKSLLVALAVSISVGGGMAAWRLPPPDKYAPVEMPDRVVKLVKSEPPPPPKQAERKPEEKKEDEVADKSPAKDQKPTTAEVQQARAKAEGTGVLAFKKNFADLMSSVDEPRLGADANLGVDVRRAAGSQAVGLTTQRALIAAQASGSSGGISVAGLSRDVGTGGGGKAITGVKLARVEDAIGGGEGKEAARPLSKGPGPSRTDEEIQIVFDRHKAALYRAYNRELRNDPTLRGKIVLRITIEPNGEVSACKVDASAINSPSLVADIVERVKKFNFGPKENVPRTTIIYPIDFLPAS